MPGRWEVDTCYLECSQRCVSKLYSVTKISFIHSQFPDMSLSLWSLFLAIGVKNMKKLNLLTLGGFTKMTHHSSESRSAWSSQLLI